MSSSIRYGVVAALGLLGVLVTLLQFVSPHLYLAADSFTYFTMARQFHDAGLLFSYSGVDHTTGIHPGFYFLLLPLYPLFALALPQWIFVVGGILILGGMYAIHRRYGPVVAGTVSLLVLTVPGLEVTNNGMESSLLFAALAVFSALVTKVDIRFLGAREALLIGLSLTLAILARLDTVFLALAFAGYVGIRTISVYGLRGILDSIRPGLLIVIPVVTALLPTFALYHYFGGSIMPISGGLKSTLPDISPQALETLLSLKLFVAALALAGIYMMVAYRRGVSVGVIPVLFGGTLVMYLYNGLFVLDIGAWYGTLPFFLAALTLGFMVRDYVHSGLPHTRMIVGLLFIVGVCGVLVSHSRLAGVDWVTPHREAAEFLNTNAREGSAAAELKDGVFAFYSNMPVYGLTGLANNQEYLDAQTFGRVTEYLAERNIRYIVGGNFGSGVQVPGAQFRFVCEAPFYDQPLVSIYETGTCAP